MSHANMGLRLRALIALAICAVVMTGSVAAVDVISMSASDKRAFDLGQGQGEAAELARQLLCTIDAAIGDKQATDVVADKVLCDQLDRHTGTNKQGRVFLEPREKLLCEMHGR